MSKTVDHKRYVRTERAGRDLNQKVFTVQGGSQENPSRLAKITERGIDPYKSVTCPFCLSYQQLRALLISTKKGYDRGNGKCPLCGYKMKLQTLLKVMTSPEQYAVFAFEYPAWRFWERVKEAGFEAWKKRLFMMGWSERFWTEYKNRRGDPEKEAEEERINALADDYEMFFQQEENVTA